MNDLPDVFDEPSVYPGKAGDLFDAPSLFQGVLDVEMPFVVWNEQIVAEMEGMLVSP